MTGSGPARVAVARVEGVEVGAVEAAVSRAMDEIRWEEAMPAPEGSLFVKLNCMSGEPMPGTCTSPWVVKGFLAKVRERFPRLKIRLGDADGYSVRQVEAYMKNWGVDKICAEYDADAVNLSKVPTQRVRIGPVLGELDLPRILVEADRLVTLPVVKTHCLTRMTGALKNQWGLLPKIRYRYHPVVNQAIAEVNAYFDKLALAVADMTISQEGPGPRCGVPIILDMVLCSRDRVALDTAAAWLIGHDAREIGHIVESEAKGVGTMQYELAGDKVEPVQLKPAVAKEHLLYRWRDRLQKVAVLNKLLFDFEPIYFVLGKLARFYNKKIWYDRVGVAQARDILNHPLYGKEYQDIFSVPS